jgi:hypothetical protein
MDDERRGAPSITIPVYSMFQYSLILQPRLINPERSRKVAKGRERSRKIVKDRERSRKVAKGRERSRKVAKDREMSRKVAKGRERSQKVAKGRERSLPNPRSVLTCLNYSHYQLYF